MLRGCLKLVVVGYVIIPTEYLDLSGFVFNWTGKRGEGYFSIGLALCFAGIDVLLW